MVQRSAIPLAEIWYREVPFLWQKYGTEKCHSFGRQLIGIENVEKPYMVEDV
jgi:hypothetical protein